MPEVVERLVVFLPNWVGDAVMFTPALRAIRARFGPARLALAGRAAPLAALAPCPWADETIRDAGSVLALARALRRGRFDLAVLGPNSFRSALAARLAGAKRRVGYARDGRGWLLTDRLEAPRAADGSWAKTPALDYYLELAGYLGCETGDKRMELSVSAGDAAAAEELLTGAGADRARPIVLLNPGASFGASKMYPPGRFAAVADALIQRRGAQIIINAAPDEGEVAGAVERAMNESPLVNLAAVANSLGLLKALVARSKLMITNDTGPRHFAAALGVPVVTIFGATDPDWTTIYYERERIVRVRVSCGPCQRKTCRLPEGPKKHQCMLKIPPEMVLAAAEELLDHRSEASGSEPS